MKKNRTFGLSSFAVDNGASILLMVVMVMLFGIKSYMTMPKELMPEVILPTIFVNTVYFGNSGEDIESLITRPIEKELKSISGIKTIKSTSMQDFSVIVTEFETYVEQEDALRKIKDAVDKAKNDLPSDLQSDPSIQDVNLSELPIITVNVFGNFSNEELKEYAEKFQDEIESLGEVNKVVLKGTRDKEVQVNVDLTKLSAVQLSYRDIESAIQSENLTMSGGEMVNNGFRRGIRVVGEFDNPENIENIIIKSEHGKQVYLKDVASVKFAYSDQVSIARTDGLPVVSLDIIKKKGSNLIAAVEKLKKIVDKIKPTLPDELQVSYFNDQSVQAKNMVSNLENSIISGMLLVILVLLFFMGMRNAVLVGIAIPLSMLMGMMILQVMGYTLNMVVLFSLILALGMLVDNGIVVVENIYRYRQQGYGRIEAARYGAGEVAIPIITSTATTLAAFGPLIFWPGLMGSFMAYLPITLIVVLTSSLFVGLVINPVLTSYFMEVEDDNPPVSVKRRKRKNFLIFAFILLVLAIFSHFNPGENYLWRNTFGIVLIFSLINHFIFNWVAKVFQNTITPIYEGWYQSTVTFIVKGWMPIIIFAGTILLLIASFSLIGAKEPKVVFFPDTPPNYINAFVELPLGTDINKTEKIVRQIEEKINKAIAPSKKIVEAVLTQIGEGTSDPNGPPEPGASPNKARLTVSFIKEEDRDGINTFDLLSKIRTTLKSIPGVDIIVDKDASGPPMGKPINLEITGDNIDELVVLSEKVMTYLNLKDVKGVEKLTSDIKVGKPELIVNIDRQAARSYGLSTYSIADALRTSVFGKEVSKYKDGEDDYPIMIRSEIKNRNNIDALMAQKITFRSQADGQIRSVPISSVANVSYSSTYQSIKRNDLKRVVTIYSNVLDGYNGNNIVEELKSHMEDYDLPSGFEYVFAGEQEQQAETMQFLSSAFGIALFLIFLIIVLQFNSVITPIIILLSVLFSTIGVLLGIVFTGSDIVVVMTGMGVISLAGIVVNNAIVLIDYINLLIEKRRAKLGLQSGEWLSLDEIRVLIAEGGKTRLRPVILTAITTVLGLVPLAIGLNINFFTILSDLDPQLFIGGSNAEMWGPMAWTVINGLVFSTFLTLLVVPVMYLLAYRMVRFSSRFFGSKA